MLKPFPALAAVLLLLAAASPAAEPLRIYLCSGPKTHGPGQHDHPRFLAEWSKLLTERGATVSGGNGWPAPEQFDALDEIIVFAKDPWDVTPETRAAIDKFAARGGAFVALHDGICSRQDPAWVKSVIGGSWRYGTAKYFEGELDWYYVKNDDPIVAGASNFRVRDEMYYDLEMHPEAEVLAATWTPDARAQKNGRAFPTIYNVAPQMWSFDDHSHRAFVDLLGHNYSTLELPQVRAVLLRGIAWAAKRAQIDEFCSKEELASLPYPPGGPLRPQDELAQLVVHPEFSVSLVAAEPLINKPIALDWDARGRLWVAETPEYPNGRRGLRGDFAGVEWKDHGGLVAEPGVQMRPAQDRISILSDTDGDGVMDRKEIFYQGLELVTGFVFHRDGVIVSAAPDILWVRDTDGDGKADTVVRLYTGLGNKDTHAVINNLRWGFDGWIYATHGYSGSDHVTTGDGRTDFGRIGSGVVRFKPDGSAFEQYSSKGGNTWGLSITAENNLLWTQATSGDLLMETLLPEPILARGKVGDTSSFKVVTKSPPSFPLMAWEEQAYRQIDHIGSFTAADGCAIYEGGAWPARFRGTYFTTEPTVNIVHQEWLEPDGLSLKGAKEPGREQTEFITSKDMWFRPIEVRVGPDGALYVLDFYNQAVIHNDTRGPVHNNVNAAVRPDRDHYFGRIWRVDHREAKPAPAPNFQTADAETLLRALSAPNFPQRSTIQRLLLERLIGATPASGTEAASIRARLTELALGSAPEPRVHALWILHQSGGVPAETLAAVIRADDPVVSRNGLKIVAEQTTVDPAVAGALAERLTGPDPRVQLAALIALGNITPTPDLARAVIAATPTLGSPYLQSALLGGASRAPAEYLAAALVAPADQFTPAVRALISDLARAAASQPGTAAQLLTLLGKGNLPADRALPVLIGLGDRARIHTPPPWTPALQAAFAHLLEVPDLQTAAVPVALAWDKEGAFTAQIRPLIARMQARLSDAAAPEEELLRLVPTLVAARRLTTDVLPSLARLLGSSAPVALQKNILIALGETDDAASGQVLIAAYAKLQPALRAEAFAQILKRAPWTHALVEGVKAGAVPLDSLGTIAMDKLRHYPEAGVAALARQTLDALRGPVLLKKDGVIASLLPVVEKGGDVAAGKQLFQNTCAVCHTFNGEGRNLAPDLTGMGAHPRAELLTNIVDPNREVDPSFIAYDFQTNTGETFQGIIARENTRTVLVRDAAGQRELNKADLIGRQEVGRSLMPEGFEALGGEALRDIIAYLQSGDTRFRVIDLRAACNADSRQGLFASPEREMDTLQFKRFGNVRVGDVPFVILDPVTAGRNLIVLRGGDAPLSKSYARRVEIAVPHVEANFLEILGGVGGWAFPCCGDEKGAGLPAAKVTVTYEDGSTEEIVMKNGVEFADYVRPHDVPGSKSAAELVNGQQVRIIRKALRGGLIAKLTLESYENRIAPVFVAITAERTERK